MATVSNFKSFFGGFTADVSATTEEEAREAIISHLGGNNTPEYISEDSSEIAINDVVYGVSATHLTEDTYSVEISTAE